MITDSYKILLGKGLTTTDIFYESEGKIKVYEVASCFGICGWKVELILSNLNITDLRCY